MVCGYGVHPQPIWIDTMKNSLSEEWQRAAAFCAVALLIAERQRRTVCQRRRRSYPFLLQMSRPVSCSPSPFDRLLLPFLKRSPRHRIAGLHRQLDDVGNIRIRQPLRTILENSQRQLRSFNRFLQCFGVALLSLVLFLPAFPAETIGRGRPVFSAYLA